MKVGTSAAHAAPLPSKAKPVVPAKLASNSNKKETQKGKELERQATEDKQTAAVVKPKATGKLDFSKAKVKETKEEPKEVKETTKNEQKGKRNENFFSNKKPEPTAEKKSKEEAPKV
jgi:DNA polymerase delta subunit 3